LLAEIRDNSWEIDVFVARQLATEGKMTPCALRKSRRARQSRRCSSSFRPPRAFLASMLVWKSGNSQRPDHCVGRPTASSILRYG